MPYDEVRSRYRGSIKGKETAREYSRKYYHKVLKFNPVEIDKRRKRNTENHYKRQYGLTALQAKELKLLGCFICGLHKTKLNIDHDHKTGKVRGVLCNACNLMLGYIEKSEQFKEAITNYLDKREDIKIAV